ncbi:hypothetical protein P22_2660 [Propionispora sp. 2/2-37]|uniref:CCA tRNA nucleotidyltransferase n=1 Tax=Propionispora sp. 2/2-37 TaxID=1677858 RepID=UPI0006BB8681|nr:polynucleotide adenylyltransferase [Propionispora sp. 2/2-37]CUH96570.1 hypothetical protein P22_2660 [Propionispora sp. 2/2-37]
MEKPWLTEQEFARMIAANGGRLYRVGGCVRDALRGMKPKDRDYCVTGMVKKQFKMLFPAAEEYGKAFPVFCLWLENEKCEVAFARTERKVGSGYKGFKIQSNPNVTIEEDLLRRDTTVNSIAVDCLTGEVIDPFGGIQDLQSGILRATSRHFSDDPIRSLRLAGQSARLGFSVDPCTLRLARATAGELANEPVARMMAELRKVLMEAQEPSAFFKVLAAAGLLQATFVEVAELPVVEFQSSMEDLDKVAATMPEAKSRFAVLGLHLIRESLERWNQRMTLPGDWLAAAVAVGKMRALLKQAAPENIVDAVHALSRGALRLDEFNRIARAVSLPIPDLHLIKARMDAATGVMPAGLKGSERGAWLRRQQIEAVAGLV